MRRMNKKGQWQNYLLPAILAVLVLGISFYFIFNEYFTGEDIDREVCKQSIMARNAMPEFDVAGFTIVSLKDEFPLKCKTKVIEVDEDDVKINKDKKRNVDKIIGNALVECWFIFGNGDADVFEASVYGKRTTCIPCARIHFTNEAKKAVLADKELKGRISIKGLLEGENIEGENFRYLDYLRGVGNKFDPFNPAFNNNFNLSGEKFKVGKFDSGTSLKRIRGGSEIKMNGEFANVTLPEYFNVSQGDLIIAMGEVTDSGDDEAANYIPYMFYFQNGQPNYLDEMDNKFFSGGVNDEICNAWEGIPA